MFLLNALIASGALWLAFKLSRALARRKRLTSKFDRLPAATYSAIHPIFDTINLMLIDAVSIKRKQIDSFVHMYNLALAQCKVFQDVGLFGWYLGIKPVVVLFSPENVEAILQSPRVLNKADEYRVFEPWLGEGLVTSKRPKWQVRRKLLTPAFHFTILNDFLPTINEEASKLIRKLNNGKYSRSFDVASVIALCTLDTICETAMGVNINCQADEESDYVKSLYEVGETSLARVCRPWLWPEFIFKRTEVGRRFRRASECMHKFTRTVILDRKAEWQQLLKAVEGEKHALAATVSGDSSNLVNENESSSSQQPSGGLVKKITFEDLLSSSSFRKATKRLAFLDLLMHQHLVENSMSLEDIREEVDTFMFAGHDTTAMNISWALYLLGLHADIQERVRSELDDIFASQAGDETDADELPGDGSRQLLHSTDRPSRINDKLKLTDVTVEQLARMKYLDMVVKETLRMFPSIPFVARQMTEDVLVGGKYLIPEGATCTILTHALHNNSKVFPKPELFDPERFLPENTSKRHPFAYIPFSAGARNCIGQKFAKMEVKIILAKIIRNYRVESTLERDKLKLVGELVLRPTEGLPIRLMPLKFGGPKSESGNQ